MPPPARLMLLATLLGALSCGGAAVGTLWWRNEPQRALADAKQRWAAHTPQRYQLEVDSGAGCTIATDVRQGQTPQVISAGRCLHPARTVEQMFAVIERVSPRRIDCATFGCACAFQVGTHASYDAALGYPRRIAVWTERTSNWWSPDLWTFTWQNRALPTCSRYSESVVLEVISLTPH